jgi:hypothetical protein
MTAIHIVTYCPPWAEYNSQRSNVKAFYNKDEAREFIEEELEKEKEKSHDEFYLGTGDFEIGEVELV